ncbi:MAG: FAD-binding protein [Betaproteobacteria bacterium]
MATLVIGEHHGGHLKTATRSALAAAARLGGDIDLLLAGTATAEVAEQARRAPGLRRVITVEAPIYEEQTAEAWADLVVHLAGGYSHLLAAATAFGKSLLPRVAALLDVAAITDVVGIESADTFVRPIYAGNALATLQSADPVKVLTIRPTAFAPAKDGEALAPVEVAAPVANRWSTRLLERRLHQSGRPELDAARVVVSGGRGLGSGENFSRLLEPLADKLHAALGASRAAVDAGYVPNDYQVGQTGKIVVPDLYFAIGISGAIQHLAGMKDAKVIVAINKDPEAPIFKVADYWLEADLFETIPWLTELC